MPQVISDIVDVYVFRRLNARVQFLLLQRKSDVTLPHTWQAFHAQVLVGDTTLDTVIRSVRDLAGLNVSEIYSADYVNQFYDENRDAVIFAPVFAVNVSPQSPIDLATDYRDAAWYDRDEATSRLPFSGQRWAVRHIDEIMSLGEAEAGIYRLDMNTPQPPQKDPDAVEDIDDDASLIDTPEPDYSFGSPMAEETTPDFRNDDSGTFPTDEEPLPESRDTTEDESETDST